MEVREGYKKTEIGVIPKVWSETPLRSITNLMTNGFVGIAKIHYTISNEGILYIQGYNVKENTFNFNGIKRVTKEFHIKNAKSNLKEGDLLTVQTGDVGLTTIVPKELEGSNCHALIISRFKKHLAHPKFFAFYLNSFTGRSRLREIETGTTMKHINVGDMIHFIVPLPPLPEQKAIAQVLSDTDHLIQSLEKLISKKSLIKQGAMQKLLSPISSDTGKPKEGWEVKKLPQVCWFQEGPGLRNWQFTKSGMKVINVTNLVKGYLDLEKTDRHISLKEFEKMYKHFEIDENDIVMASSGNSYSKVAVVRKQDLRLLMNTSVIRFKPLQGFDYNYLLIFLKSALFKDQIDLLITGGAQPNFGPFHLKKIDIAIPPTKEQQTHIATILSDMDAETEKLEKKLAKYKVLKQGLMQNLLTGKIRLT